MDINEINEIIQGTIALQLFASNAKYVEMIVDIAFAVVPTILGLGAAGLIGSSAIRTAKDVMSSISMLRSIGPAIGYGGLMAGKGLGKGVDKVRTRVGEWLIKSDNERLQKAGNILLRKNTQDTQSKQDKQASGGGGGGGSPPVPPDTKPSEKREVQAKISGIPIDEYINQKK
jgi:hypothetical protein